MNNKIGIILTVFLRNDLLYKTIQSIVPFIQPTWEIIVVDQGNLPTIQFADKLRKLPIKYYQVPYNSGLSCSRNFGVQKAKELHCDSVLLGSDSFLFNESINWIDYLYKELGTSKLTKEHNFDLVGFYLSGCACGWEAKLNLIEGQSFELDFIDKENSSDFYSNFHPFHCRIYRCDIVKNFFLATTESLLNTPWDENLKLGEHEDFFWQYKQKRYNVGWTNLITAEKMKDRPDEYAEFRRKNFYEGINKLKQKYQIQNWVTYKNLENSKKG